MNKKAEPNQNANTSRRSFIKKSSLLVAGGALLLGAHPALYARLHLRFDAACRHKPRRARS